MCIRDRNLVVPGDGIGIPPGSPAVLTTAAIPARTAGYAVSLASSIFTSAHTFTNNQQITMAANINNSNYPPAPLLTATVYSVLCNPVASTCTTFNVSLDGTNPVTVTGSDSGDVYAIPYPISQDYVVIHSTASASNLPPPGVRLDPVAYGPYLGKIQLSAPYSPGGNLMNLSRISAYYYFENIVFQTLPNAPSGESDPFPYNQLVTTGSQTDHIVFDQCWFCLLYTSIPMD